MRTADFDYDLPPDAIAQAPLEPRDASRLLVVHRSTGAMEHRLFRDVGDYLRPGDALVANDSRVLPARLYARKPSGGRVEILLLSQQDALTWTALVGGKRIKPGLALRLLDQRGQPTDIVGVISAANSNAQRTLHVTQDLLPQLDQLGHTPLPPYIHTPLTDPERYQTIYARPSGSAAAPTAGLHFTPDLLLALRDQGVLFETVTLHVGLDTFQPVSVDEVAAHTIHQEWLQITPDSARRLNQAKLAGGRLVAIGTTSVRVLESAAWRAAGETGSLRQASQAAPPAACPWQPLSAAAGLTDLFIYPGYTFRVVDALITNFHLPRSSLLMLVSAFAGRELILRAYAEAIRLGYRFYSFGDAMLIL